jgi:hypothetical protein
MNSPAATAKSPTAPAASAPVPPKPLVPLARHRLKLIVASATNFGNYWGAVQPAGTPLDHVTRPEFWSNHADQIRSSDEIRFEWDDGRGLAKGFVRQVSGVGTNLSRAVVEIYLDCEFGAIRRPPGADSTHAIDYRGPVLKHVIIRLGDNQIIADGFETPQAAGQALQAIIRRDPKA